MDWNKRKPSTLRVDLDDQEPSTSRVFTLMGSDEPRPSTSGVQRPSTSSERKPSTSSEPHPSTLYEPQPSTSSGITSTCSAHCCRRGGNSSWTIYNNTPCTICAAWLKKRMRRIENQRASTSLESQSTSDAGQNNGGHHAHHRHDSRPELSAIKKNIHRISTNREISAQLEVVLRQVEDYADSLEERTADYLEEMRRCEDLLYRVLPRTVASQLMTGEYEVIAEAYDEVTIYFSDIIGFTEISAVCTAMQVVKLLNDLYSLFDSIIEKFDVYKVETIGDAYMAVSGLPTRNGNHHAYEIARMALALRDAATTEYLPYDPTQPITLRIGMHTGPCVAGIVGMHMPRYCLFGDTVNTASRMETYSMEQRIHLSARTKALLDPYDEFIFESRGKVYVKGKGLMNTYWLVGMKDTNHPIIKPPYMPMKIISINKLAKIPEIYNNNGNDDIIEERLKVRPIIKTKTVSHDYNHQRNIAKKEYKTENLLFTKKSLKITRFQNKSEIISEYEDEAEDEAEDKAENNDKDIAENKTGIVDENKAEVLDEDETEQCDTFSPSYDRSFTISKGKVRRVIEKFENGT